MNKYLLLRDNKQSGPYSVDELKTKGLKPYDLVWLDGKSAAWRYPSEIEELRSFAPAVEEQPYDRFYKKNPAHQVATHEPSNTIAQQEKAMVQTEAPKQVTPKKIYVTLPAAQNRTVTASNESMNQAAGSETSMAEKKVAEAALSEQFARLREEKIKQAESMAGNPVVATKAITPKIVTLPDNSINDNYQTTAFSNIVEKNHPVQEEKLAPVIKPKTGSKLLLRSIVAACFLLGGVIIGLIISNNRQQQQNAAIEKLVQQIQEREKRAQVVTAPVEQPVQKNIPENDNTTLSQEIDAGQVDDQQSAIGTAVNNKQSSASTPKKETSPATNDQQQQAVKVIPAIITNKPEEKPVNRQETESARKNIHQLVAVDANKYKTGVLGGISDLHLTISNNSLYPLDQVEVEVRYLGPEKKVVKTQMLIFNDVAAGEQKTLEVPRTTRGVTVDYTITRINSKALGLAHVRH
jgi:hypothetical protein